MDAEFTARQGKITGSLQAQASEGIGRIARILGKSTRVSITMSAERRLQVAELTIRSRSQTVVASGKASTAAAALRQAFDHAENQARRYRDKRIGNKRLPKEEKAPAAPPVIRPKALEAPFPDEQGRDAIRSKARTAIAVHSFPSRPAVIEPHILRSSDAIALRPMTMEEAVKEAEFRDRDLLIFRGPSGNLFVLHRRRDGQMELVEIP